MTITPAKATTVATSAPPPFQLDPQVRDGSILALVTLGFPKRQAQARVDAVTVWSSAEAVIKAAELDPRIVAITAAMAGPTGLIPFQQHFPDRFFDVGIAEQHAVTSAAGMAMFLCVQWSKSGLVAWPQLWLPNWLLKGLAW